MNWLQFSADGRALLTGGVFGCKVWDIRTRSYRYQLDGPPADGPPEAWLTYAALAPDGKALATASRLDGIQWWDLATWTARPVECEAGGFGSVQLAVTPDGRTVITGSHVTKRRGIKQEELLGAPVHFHNTPAAQKF